jgi:hypothetical protein
MIKKRFFFLAVLMMVASPISAQKIAGIDMPETLMVGNETLLLNGAGLREKYALGVDVYVAGLYLKNASHDEQAIIPSDDTMAIRLHIVTKLITSEKFTDSTIKGFAWSCKNQGIDMAAIQPEIDRFVAIFNSGITKDDIYDIIHVKGAGVKVFKNKSKTPVVTIRNFTLKKALFGIWLTESPEDRLKVVRKALLGI